MTWQEARRQSLWRRARGHAGAEHAVLGLVRRALVLPFTTVQRGVQMQMLPYAPPDRNYFTLNAPILNKSVELASRA